MSAPGDTCRHGLTADCGDCFMEVCGGSEFAHPDDPIAHGPRWRAERDHWIRVLNRLEAAVSHHRRDKGDIWVDEVDDELYVARDRILTAAAGAPGSDELADTDPIVDGLLALDGGAGPPECVAAAIALYADRVITETTGMWPPAARATACHEGLRLIAAECRRGSAAGTTEEEHAA